MSSPVHFWESAQLPTLAWLHVDIVAGSRNRTSSQVSALFTFLSESQSSSSGFNFWGPARWPVQVQKVEIIKSVARFALLKASGTPVRHSTPLTRAIKSGDIRLPYMTHVRHRRKPTDVKAAALRKCEEKVRGTNQVGMENWSNKNSRYGATSTFTRKASIALRNMFVCYHPAAAGAYLT